MSQVKHRGMADVDMSTGELLTQINIGFHTRLPFSEIIREPFRKPEQSAIGSYLNNRSIAQRSLDWVKYLSSFQV